MESVTIFAELDEGGTPYICFGTENRYPMTREEAEELLQALYDFLDDATTRWYEDE